MFLGKDLFTWWIGVVEENFDPELIGRVRVRIFGYHSPKHKEEILTDDLPWATCINAPNVQGAYGRPNVGDWVVGFFLDSTEAQEPIVWGVLPGNVKSKLGEINGLGFSKETNKSFPSVYVDNTSPIDTNRHSYLHEINQKVRLMLDPDGGKTFKPKIQLKDVSTGTGLEIYSTDLYPTKPDTEYQYLTLSNSGSRVTLTNDTTNDVSSIEITSDGEITISGKSIKLKTAEGTVDVSNLI